MLKLNFDISFLTGVPVSSNLNFSRLANQTSIFKRRVKTKKLLCKNFFLFLLLIEKLTKSRLSGKQAQKTTISSLHCSFPRLSKKRFILLRSSFRNKVSKQKFIVQRFKLKLLFSVVYTNIFKKNFAAYKLFLLLNKKVFYFNTNILHQHRFFIYFKGYFNKSAFKL